MDAYQIAVKVLKGRSEISICRELEKKGFSRAEINEKMDAVKDIVWNAKQEADRLSWIPLTTSLGSN
jgi:hypothetical protein